MGPRRARTLASVKKPSKGMGPKGHQTKTKTTPTRTTHKTSMRQTTLTATTTTATQQTQTTTATQETQTDFNIDYNWSDGIAAVSISTITMALFRDAYEPGTFAGTLSLQQVSLSLSKQVGFPDFPIPMGILGGRKALAAIGLVACRLPAGLQGSLPWSQTPTDLRTDEHLPTSPREAQDAQAPDGPHPPGPNPDAPRGEGEGA